MIEIRRDQVTQKPEIKRTQLSDGRKADVLTVAQEQKTELVVVPKSVMAYLIGLIPIASFTQLKVNFMTRIEEDAYNTQQLCDIIREELEFHETVNLCKEYFNIQDDEAEMPEAVGREV